MFDRIDMSDLLEQYADDGINRSQEAKPNGRPVPVTGTAEVDSATHARFFAQIISTRQDTDSFRSREDPPSVPDTLRTPTERLPPANETSFNKRHLCRPRGIPTVDVYQQTIHIDRIA
jgi:hypothetical protein